MSRRKLEFYSSVQKFVDKCKENQDKFVQQFCQELLYRMVVATPVKYGFARASWYVGINKWVGGSPQSPKAKEQKVDWNKAFAEAAFQLDNAKMGDTIHLLNNCVYILKLEYGHSKQAPRGMVRVTLNNFMQIAEDVVKRLNG